MELQASFYEIRKRELDFYSNNCQSLGTQAALLAGFAYGGLSGVDISPETPDALRALFFVFVTMAMGFTFTAMINSSLASMLGPGYALRGPEGSYHHAVEALMLEYKLVFINFVLGMCTFYIAAFLYIWLAFDWRASLPLFLFMAGLFVVTVKDALRVMSVFRLPTGLAVSGRFNADGTITPYTTDTAHALELRRLQTAPSLANWPRRVWLRVHIELDEFLGTNDLLERERREQREQRAQERAEREEDRPAARNTARHFLLNLEGRGRSDDPIPAAPGGDSGAVELELTAPRRAMEPGPTTSTTRGATNGLGGPCGRQVSEAAATATVSTSSDYWGRSRRQQ